MDGENPFGGNVVTLQSSTIEPDMSVLTGGRRPAPEMPLDMFGDFWGRWITEQAACISVPTDFVAYPLLSCCASLIGNSRRVYAGGKWSEPAIIWTVVVGNPSSRKSSAVDVSFDPLRTVEADLSEGFGGTLRQWETDREFAKAKKDAWQIDVKEAVKIGRPAPELPTSAVEPERPVMPRIVVSDTTPEALQKMLHANKRGLLCWRDELSGLIEGFGRYSGGKGGDRALWIEAFGGKSYTVDRAGKPEPLFIKNLSVSITGGMQPDKAVSLLMSGDDDGLAARFLMTFPEPIRPGRPQGGADNAEAVRAFRRLRSLPMGSDDQGQEAPVTLPITSAALDILTAWQQAAFDTDYDAAGLFASHTGKFPSYVLRLALVTELMKWAAGSEDELPQEVGTDAVALACNFMDQYARPMAQRVYGDAAMPQADRGAAQIAKRIVKERHKTVNARIVRAQWRLPGLKTAEDVRDAFEVLKEAGWLFEAGTRQGETPGRQSSDYRVNPGVFGDG